MSKEHEKQLIDCLVEKHLTLEQYHLWQSSIIIRINYRKLPKLLDRFQGDTYILEDATVKSNITVELTPCSHRSTSLYNHLMCNFRKEAFYVLEKFKNLPEERQGKFMVDQESFLKNNISKLNRQLEKAKFKNQELDEKLLLIEYLKLEGKNFLDPGRLESLIGLDHQLDKRIDFTTKRIEFFEGVGRNQVDAGVDSDEMVAILVSGGVVIQPIQNKLCEQRA
ncbi:hypothetical protein PS2_019585 [Malus domestica]